MSNLENVTPTSTDYEFCNEKLVEKLTELKSNFEGDGFDYAYVIGFEHVTKESGDGGISENYFKGLLDAVDFYYNGEK